jgi:hypothetical protein
VIAAPIAADWGADKRAANDGGHRRFKRAVGVAIGTLTLGAVAALLVAFSEGQLLAPAGGSSARAPLPGDLFAAPRAPMPRVIIRYAAPRSAPLAPVAATAAPKPIPTATPSARPTSSGRHHPSPSPSPSGGGDD